MRAAHKRNGVRPAGTLAPIGKEQGEDEESEEEGSVEEEGPGEELPDLVDMEGNEDIVE